MEVCDIGTRRELLVDDALIADTVGDVELRLHHPVPRDVVLFTDRPWEGCMSTYLTVLRDADRYRLYYLAYDIDLSRSTGDGPGLAERSAMAVCMAESNDGLCWSRPELGVVEHEGSSRNNIVWEGTGPNQCGVHGFAPFIDANPDADPRARYKAIGGERRATKGDLYAMVSADGVRWSPLQETPIMRQGRDAKFDSQNLGFWDSVRGEYRAYVRDFREGRRDIKTATSPDFVNWTQPEWLSYPAAPPEQLYTNQVQPYYRAPHIFVGFPSRYVQRAWDPAVEALPEPEHRQFRSSVNERFGTALTDGLFMSSRDGRTFKRWGEAFIRPGPQLRGNWAYGDNYQCWGMIETPSSLEGAPTELSFFAREGIWRGDGMSIRRYSLRVDGFVSLNARRSGGDVVTVPLRFDGNTLELNVATSAAGSVRVEIQDEQGVPLSGFALDDCSEIIGDELCRAVRWANGPDISALAGRPVRLRLAMNDADIYSFRFLDPSTEKEEQQ